MAKPDYAHRMTDAELAQLERRISAIYQQAADELSDTVNAYFEQFEKRDAAMKEKLDAGEITEQQYKQWRLAQMGRGKRFTALRDKVAERYTNANETAVAYVNDATPGIYTLNRNYAAYKIEQVSDKADFTLWDEQTVKRLIVKQPDLMPYYPPKRALQRGIDLKYGKQQITASVTSSILQGKGIGKISDDLQSRMQNMNRTSAIRTARTAVTGAQNAGRLDTCRAAQDMGIKLKKQWVATLDNRTRHAHAMLDGQTVDVDKPFKVDGYELMYPGDNSAPGYLVYNCRCTQIAEVDGEGTSSGGRRSIDPKTGESVLVKDMTYAEWAGWKKEEEKEQENIDLRGRKSIWSAWDDYRKRFVGHGVEVKAQDIENNTLLDTVKISKLDKNVSASIVDAIDDLGNRYYSPLTKLTVMDKTDSLLSHAFAVVNHQWGLGSAEMRINPLKVTDSGRKHIFDLSQKGYCVKFASGDEIKYVITHEYGHSLLNIGEKLPGKAQNFALVDFTAVKKARKEIEPIWDEYCNTVQAAKDNYDKIRKPIETKMIFGTGEVTDADREAIATAKKKYDSIKISDYSLTNADEFVAECFADAEVGTNPSEYSLAVSNIIKKYFGKA